MSGHQPVEQDKLVTLLGTTRAGVLSKHCDGVIGDRIRVDTVVASELSPVGGPGCSRP